MKHTISVSIVYATVEKQWLKELVVPRGTLADELVLLSGILDEADGLEAEALDDLILGVYSQKIPHDYLLLEGDRVEIYRPLTADPKDVRRQLAELGKTMGKR